MADSENTPLTDAERAELEELRAEKARREEEERARRERSELEALRAEKAAAEAPSDPAPAQKLPVSRPATHRVSKPAPVPEPAEKTFGQRMVTTDVTDDDGIPAMPPAQKIILAVCALLVLAFVIWNFVK